MDIVRSRSANSPTTNTITVSPTSSLSVLPSGLPSGLGKRRAQTRSRASSQSHRKRLKLYNDSYREFYNEAVLCVVSDGEDDQLEQSQIGLTTWTASEKAILFRSLARNGRHDLPRLATAIGTKSEIEARAYLLFLDELSLDQQINSPHESLLDHSVIPAAFEISSECEAALEGAGDALAFLQQQEDEKAEKQKYGVQWQLTKKFGKKTNRGPIQIEEGEVQELEFVPEAELLNLQNFLTLTRRFFMNSADPEYHWRTHAVDRLERPSIFRTAFSDLYNLTLSVTKRLIHSAIFLAMSRLRSMAGSKRMYYHRVKRRDILAATKVVGLRENSHEYWVGLARRCKLTVYERKERSGERLNRSWRKVFKGKLNYDSVERMLDHGRKANSQFARTQLQISSRATSLSNHTASTESSNAELEDGAFGSETGSNPEASSDSLSVFSEDESPSDHRAAQIPKIQDHRAREQDEFTSALDHQASLNEERRVWLLLHKTTATLIQPKETTIPKKPIFEPKLLEDISDWRQWLIMRPNGRLSRRL